MKRTMAVSLTLLLLLASCGRAGTGARLDDLQKSNEDLTRRVKALEDELLQAEKKQIQDEQALQQMRERIRDMENAVNKIQLGPSR